MIIFHLTPNHQIHSHHLLTWSGDYLTTLRLTFLKFKVGIILPTSQNCYKNMYEYSKMLIIILV